MCKKCFYPPMNQNSPYLVGDESDVAALWTVDVDDALFLSRLGRSVTT